MYPKGVPQNSYHCGWKFLLLALILFAEISGIQSWKFTSTPENFCSYSPYGERKALQNISQPGLKWIPAVQTCQILLRG